MATTTISVGIDVSKKKLDIAVLFSGHTTTGNVFENTIEGISDLVAFLKTQGVAKATPCVLESTGDYHLLVSVMLTQEGFMVNCINPLRTCSQSFQQNSNKSELGHSDTGNNQAFAIFP